MEAAVPYLLMLQKFINSKQKLQKKFMHCAQLILQKILKLIILNEALKLFFRDFNPIDNNNILDIHKYVMKRT